MQKLPKEPGVYKITVLTTGKIYFGSTKNLRNRYNRYNWAVHSDKNYSEVTRPITIAMREAGWDNIKFEIVRCDDACKDHHIRKKIENYYITTYCSNDPNIGYNITDATNPVEGMSFSRPQSPIERTRRAKPIVVYNIDTDQALYFLGGAKSAGDYFGYKKDVASHSVKRGNLVDGKWYWFPVTSDELNKSIARSAKRNSYSHNRYMAAVKRYIKFAKAEYGLDLEIYE